jgi:23S rRNA pseudouridine2605 synthase
VHNATIYELLPSEFQHYYYIGRLDKESRGLLVLTDSPRLVHQHEHPRFNITKEYLIQLSCDLDPMDIKKMKNGIFDEGECLKFQDIAPTSLAHQYKVLLNEGKKRHIRRVIKSL